MLWMETIESCMIKCCPSNFHIQTSHLFSKTLFKSVQLFGFLCIQLFNLQATFYRNNGQRLALLTEHDFSSFLSYFSSNVEESFFYFPASSIQSPSGKGHQSGEAWDYQGDWRFGAEFVQCFVRSILKFFSSFLERLI